MFRFSTFRTWRVVKVFALTLLFFPVAKWSWIEGSTKTSTVMHISSKAMTTAFETWSSAKGISATDELGKLKKLRRDHPTREKVMSLFVYADSQIRPGYRSENLTVHSLHQETYAELSVVRDVLLRMYEEGEVTFYNPTSFHWWWDFLKVDVERRPRFETRKEMGERKERERREREEEKRKGQKLGTIKIPSRKSVSAGTTGQGTTGVFENDNASSSHASSFVNSDNSTTSAPSTGPAYTMHQAPNPSSSSSLTEDASTADSSTDLYTAYARHPGSADVFDDSLQSSSSTPPASNTENGTSTTSTGTSAPFTPVQSHDTPTSNPWSAPSSRSSASFKSSGPQVLNLFGANTTNGNSGSPSVFARSTSGPSPPSGDGGSPASTFTKTTWPKMTFATQTGGKFAFRPPVNGSASPFALKFSPFGTPSVQASPSSRTNETNGLSGPSSGMATTASFVPPTNDAPPESRDSTFEHPDTSRASTTPTQVSTNGTEGTPTFDPPRTNNSPLTFSNNPSCSPSILSDKLNTGTSTTHSEAYAFLGTHPSSGDNTGSSTQFDGGATAFVPPPNLPSNPFSSPGTRSYEATTFTPITTASSRTSSTSTSASAFKLGTGHSPQIFQFGKYTSGGTTTPSVDAKYPASQKQPFSTFGNHQDQVTSTSSSAASEGASFTSSTNNTTTSLPQDAQPFTAGNTSNGTSEPSVDASQPPFQPPSTKFRFGN